MNTMNAELEAMLNETPVKKINYVLTLKESIFEGKVLKEHINQGLLERLIRNPQLLKDANGDGGKAEMTQLKAYLAKSKNGVIPVSYYRCNNIGRSYAEKALSLQQIRKEVRHTLCDGNYIDLDVENAHPVMLYQICKMNGMDLPRLKNYVEKRDLLLGFVMKTYGVERSDAKNVFIRILYGGKAENWLKDLDIQEPVIKVLLMMEEEIKGISNIISSLNKKHLDTINGKKKSKAPKNYGCYSNNKVIKNEDKECFLPYYLQEQENRVLEVVYQHLKRNGKIEGGQATLCYDGIMIKKTDNIEELLKELDAVVLEETGLNLTFTQKELNKGFKLEDFKQEINAEDTDEVSRVLTAKWNNYKATANLSAEEEDDFDLHFFTRILTKCEYPLNFTLMKSYFEEHFIFILKENSFYQVRKKHKYDSKKNLQIQIELEEYPERALSKIKVETNKGQQSFLSLLEKDGLKMYKSIIFEPERQPNRNYFNIFSGFGYEQIKEEQITNKQRLNFKKFLNYILRFVCEGDKKQFNYLMCFLANIIQHPEWKPQICLILFSKAKGTGKSSLCKMLRKIMGLKHSFIGNVSVIFEKHSTSNEYKFLNIIEELDSKMGNENYEALKDKIQAEDININKKFKDIIELKDYTRYIITTNDHRALSIDRDHRRFNCFNFQKTDDEEVLELLNEVYEKNSNIYVRLFGDYLSTYDIEFGKNRNSWIENREGSDSIKLFLKTDTIQESFINIYNDDFKELFGIFNDDNKFIVLQSKFYDMYAENFDKKYCLKKKNFKQTLLSYEFVESKKSSKYYYHIDLKAMYDYLKKECLTDEETFENRHLEQ